jgi:formate--tetrahydrofolate ligase
LQAGLVNLERHIDNLVNVFGMPCVVAINHRLEDTEAEVALLERMAARKGVKVILSRHFAQGGKGAANLAHEVVRLADESPRREPTYAYASTDTLWEKVCQVARKIYHAGEITADTRVRNRIQKLQDDGYGHFPICIAKTPYSFSTDQTLRGAPQEFTVIVREVRLAAGAEFIVVICGDVMTMPGLPRQPAALSIDLDESGKIIGLF